MYTKYVAKFNLHLMNWWEFDGKNFWEKKIKNQKIEKITCALAPTGKTNSRWNWSFFTKKKVERSGGDYLFNFKFNVFVHANAATQKLILFDIVRWQLGKRKNFQFLASHLNGNFYWSAILNNNKKSMPFKWNVLRCKRNVIPKWRSKRWSWCQKYWDGRITREKKQRAVKLWSDGWQDKMRIISCNYLFSSFALVGSTPYIQITFMKEDTNIDSH